MDHFLSKFDIRLEAHVASGRALKQEPEINVNDVPSITDHDIPVMSVLDLKQPRHYAVTGHTFDKILPSVLESHRVFITVSLKFYMSKLCRIQLIISINFLKN